MRYRQEISFWCSFVTELGEGEFVHAPRRFGKSLNISMLKTFLEIGCDRKLFEGLNISKEKEICEEYMGKFPVVSVSLKDVDGADFASACSMMCFAFGSEAFRFQFLQGSDRLTETEKEIGRKAVILIDEYDVPLAKANERGYYDRLSACGKGKYLYGVE